MKRTVPVIPLSSNAGVMRPQCVLSPSQPSECEEVWYEVYYLWQNMQFKASSIFEMVSIERFSLPLSTLETYCWLQPIRSANFFWVSPICSILSSIARATCCEKRSHGLLARLDSAASLQCEGLTDACASKFFLMSIVRNSVAVIKGKEKMVRRLAIGDMLYVALPGNEAAVVL